MLWDGSNTSRCILYVIVVLCWENQGDSPYCLLWICFSNAFGKNPKYGFCICLFMGKLRHLQKHHSLWASIILINMNNRFVILVAFLWLFRLCCECKLVFFRSRNCKNSPFPYNTFGWGSNYNLWSWGNHDGRNFGFPRMFEFDICA